MWWLNWKVEGKEKEKKEREREREKKIITVNDVWYEW